MIENCYIFLHCCTASPSAPLGCVTSMLAFSLFSRASEGTVSHLAMKMHGGVVV
jgi:hypothetical protein